MPQERSLIDHAKFFYDRDETLIFSALSGIMGEVFVTEKASPRSAAVLIGDFCFFSGQCSPDFIRFISNTAFRFLVSYSWDAAF